MGFNFNELPDIFTSHSTEKSITEKSVSFCSAPQTGTMASKSPPPSPSLLRRIVDLDTAISLRLYTLTHPILPYYFLKTLEISGDGFLFFPLILSLLLYPLTLSTTTETSNNIFLINLLLGGIVDLIVIGSLKHLIRRPRPVYNKNMFLSFSVDHWSFPSGHSSRVSFIATVFYLYSDFVKDILIQLKYDLFVDYLMLIVIGWAATTSLSRILLGRHFMFDVVAGVFLGVLEGMFVFWIFNYVTLTSFLK